MTLPLMLGWMGCGRDSPGVLPTPHVPAVEASLPTLTEYGTRLLDEVYRARMLPLTWSVGTEESFEQVRPILDILVVGADHFAALEERKAAWDEKAEALRMHVSALTDALQRQGTVLGEDMQFDFLRPQLEETGAMARLLYWHVNGFLSRHGYWGYGFGLKLSPQWAGPEGEDGVVTAALCLWQRPTGLYQVSTINPPELLQLHPELRQGAAHLVMVRKKDEPYRTRNVGLPPSTAALAEGQSVLIVEDKLEKDNEPLEELVQHRADQFESLAFLDFSTAAQGIIGYSKDPATRTLRVYARHMPILSAEDACRFSILQLALQASAWQSGQTVEPRLVRYERAAFYAWHELEHLKYSRGDNQEREVLNRAYLNVDAYAHERMETAAALSHLARLQQEIEADLAGLAKAPCGGLLSYLGELLAQLGGAPVNPGNAPKRVLTHYLLEELQAHPETYSLNVVAEDPVLTSRLRDGARPVDMKEAMDKLHQVALRSAKEAEEFVLDPGAHALSPRVQILGQIYRLAQSPLLAGRLVEALRERMALDSRRNALAEEILSDQAMAESEAASQGSASPAR